MAATNTQIPANTTVPGTDNSFVIGIGASAGGLEAINELFDNLPENTNFSFVVIQHLSPDYKSLMGELLSKHTSMQVFESENGVFLRPNCVYLLPPKKLMTLRNGRIRLEEKIKSHLPNNAIDVFFESLAQDKGDKAVGIILSGTGTDGSKGIAVIKDHGGTVVVQDPLTAEFDGMPNSAIGTGNADLILPPEIIADELIEFLKETPLSKSFSNLNRQEEAILADIMDLIFKITSHDFSHYKRPTINRRLTKRMAEKGFSTLHEYYNHLKTDVSEVSALSKEFLINVTKFFRDEEAFNVIRKEVIPQLVDDPQKTDPIKVWVVACSTGEEAYSLAILFQEYIQAGRKFDKEVKIFATDIHQESIEIASKGLYTANAVKDISEERLTRFFTREGDLYRVTPALRKMVVFAKQNILKDPPFSKIDLLSCRNMLIYMNPLLQKNVMKKFHFAINENGFLFLGPSENTGSLKDSMKDVDKKWKIYRCIAKPKPGDHDTFINPAERIASLEIARPKSKNALASIADIFKETLFEEHNYAGIYIDKEFEVKQAIGNFKNFISFPEGNFNFNLLKLVPTDLSIALSTGIRKAISGNEKVVLKRVHVKDEARERLINIIVKPYLIQDIYTQPFIFIILNEEFLEARKAVVSKPGDDGHQSLMGQRLEEVEEELRNTKENLQAVIEEVESANEELQSSNEEIISSNEELQSTNEELQSLNEELHTVNAEHQLKIKELIELNDDMTNYFRTTEVGQILLDKKLVIKKFTPIATKQVNLIESDIGRSITDISTNFINLDFINEIKHTIRSGKSVEKEIQTSAGAVFIMRIAPYLRQDKMIDGVVITFINITETKRLNEMMGAIFNASTSAITALEAITDKAGNITDFVFRSANETTRNILGVSATDIIGKKWVADFPDLLAPHFESLLHIKDDGQTNHFDCYNKVNGLWLEVSAAKMPHDGIVTTFTNITQAKDSYRQLQTASNELNQMNAQLEQSNMDLLQFASVASHDLKEPLRKIQTFGNILQENIRHKLEGKEINYLDKIIRSANRMQVLIQDILTLSKLSNNEIPYAEVNLSDIITNITDDLDVSVKEKNVVIRTMNLSVIRAIPGQIHQLFQNLISNAIKFSTDTSPHITISQRHPGDAEAAALNINKDDYTCLEVEDNGIGFDPQYKDKIFGIFQRLTSDYEGTGIGLAICKKIVDNHNGYITADGELGKGARFSIFLPR